MSGFGSTGGGGGLRFSLPQLSGGGGGDAGAAAGGGGGAGEPVANTTALSAKGPSVVGPNAVAAVSDHFH